MFKGCGLWANIVVAFLFGLFCVSGGCGNPFS